MSTWRHKLKPSGLARMVTGESRGGQFGLRILININQWMDNLMLTVKKLHTIFKLAEKPWKPHRSYHCKNHPLFWQLRMAFSAYHNNGTCKSVICEHSQLRSGDLRSDLSEFMHVTITHFFKNQPCLIQFVEELKECRSCFPGNKRCG
jgi:hypothetical protein